MGVTATAAVAAAFVLDGLFGEVPGRVHPVALFGRLVAPFDRPWARPRAVGAAVALVLPGGAAAICGALTALAEQVHPAAGVAAASLALFTTTSRRMLLTSARDVVAATDGDLEAARSAAVALVGRDTGALSAGELRSASVESAAENLADGLVAPLLAFALGALVSLPVAVAAAAWVKAVNTLDSMLGYPSKPVGTASARLDDAVVWLPARASAGLLAAAALDPAALGRARRWCGRPQSPNSGWPMATLAAALGVRLHKPGAYALNPDADLPTPEQSRRGLGVVGVASLLSGLLAGVVAWL